MKKEEYQKLEEQYKKDLKEGRKPRLVSKSRYRICKNDDCFKDRRPKSAYCGECN